MKTRTAKINIRIEGGIDIDFKKPFDVQCDQVKEQLLKALTDRDVIVAVISEKAKDTPLQSSLLSETKLGIQHLKQEIDIII